MAGGDSNMPLGRRQDRPEVEVSIAPLGLPGTLKHPAGGQGIVLFAHGSGSSYLSPRIAWWPSAFSGPGSARCCSICCRPRRRATAATSSTSVCSPSGWPSRRTGCASAGGVTLTTNTDLHLS